MQKEENNTSKITVKKNGVKMNNGAVKKSNNGTNKNGVKNSSNTARKNNLGNTKFTDKKVKIETNSAKQSTNNNEKKVRKNTNGNKKVINLDNEIAGSKGNEKSLSADKVGKNSKKINKNEAIQDFKSLNNNDEKAPNKAKKNEGNLKVNIENKTTKDLKNADRDEIIKDYDKENKAERSNNTSKKVASTNFEKDIKNKANTDSEKNDKNINNSNTSGNNITMENSKKKKKIFIIIAVIVLVFVLCIFVCSFIFGLKAEKSDKIISGVSIDGVDVSNLTKEEANMKLESIVNNELAENIKLTHNDYSKELNLSDIEANVNISEAVDLAFEVGKSEGNVFADNIKVLTIQNKHENIISNVTCNTDKIIEIANTINDELPDKVVNASYEIQDKNLIIANSANGYRVNNDKLISLITDAIANNSKNIDIPVEEFQADSVDIEAIYNEVHKDAVNASYTTNPYTITKEEDGLDFAISLDEAKKLVQEDKDSFTIPLKTLKPSVTVKSLPQEAFPNSLATYTTDYSSSSANRATNVQLAASHINGIVLMPGEEFSYNNAIGERTTARGFKEAGVYLNGEVTTGIGGGICQVSSTLYNAVLKCNLEVTERTNHTFKPSYVPAGQDATVSWGSPDFRFKNNRSYPIKIVASASGGKIVTTIYGLKSDDDYEVTIESYEVGVVQYTTEYQNDSSLPAGTQKVKQSGSNGVKTETYKILSKNGTEVSRTKINSDTYKAHNQIILVGTGSSSSSSSSESDALVTIE